MSNVPTVTISKEKLGSTLLDIIAETKIVPSKSEGRRLNATKWTFPKWKRR